MTEPKPLVEMRGYIGGQDEDLGGYCRPLIIRTNSQEHYVLHEMHTYRDEQDRGKVKAKHSKVEFGKLEELLKEFNLVQVRLGINPKLLWVETDSRCGYVLPEIEFKEASKKYWKEQEELRNLRLTHTDESRLP